MKKGGARFRQKVFSPAEIRYCESKRFKYEHYAARFAAKEAVMKALNLEGKDTYRFREIEIRRTPTGKPCVHFSPAARKAFGLPKKYRLEISLTHERDWAIATAILILS